MNDDYSSDTPSAMSVPYSPYDAIMTPPPEQGSRRFSICQAFADPPSSFRSSPWCPSFRMSSPRARKSVRIAAPALSLQWDSPYSPDKGQKQSFIRSTISKNEIKHIVQDLICAEMGIPDEYEDCVEILIQAGWSPTKEHIQRNERLRATPIEHDEEEVTVELESANAQYLSSRTDEDLKLWLKQHRIAHNKQRRKGLVKVIQRHFAVTTPSRPMVPKMRLCPKTSRPVTTKKRVHVGIEQRGQSGLLDCSPEEDSSMSILSIDFDMETDGEHRLSQEIQPFEDDESMMSHEDGCVQKSLRFHFE